MNRNHILTLSAGLALLLSGCGNTGTSARQSDVEPGAQAGAQHSLQPQAIAKSFKRGIAYDLSSAADFSALAPGVSWWYNWGSSPNSSVPPDYSAHYSMDYLPMLWNGNFDAATIEGKLRANPAVKYLLVMNEPNLTAPQANLTPTQAADLWPRYEQVARNTGVKIVGPQITWGNLPNYNDPVVWLDAFYTAYRTKNGGRDPQIDFLGFHWYDYGLAGQLDRLKKYGKPFWVTEFANWHVGDGNAQIDSVAKQKAQMVEMVATLEARPDVFRYAWFTGRWTNDTHFTGLLGADGQLTELGSYYLSLPYSGAASGGTGTCKTTNAALGKAASASSTENSAYLGAQQAFDGSGIGGTRWASQWSDPQWLQVNLGSRQPLCSVTLLWEAAYAKTFQIEVSDNGTAWTPASPVVNGTGGTQTVAVSGTGQYVRMKGLTRIGGYGYSLYELQVFTAQ